MTLKDRATETSDCCQTTTELADKIQNKRILAKANVETAEYLRTSQSASTSHPSARYEGGKGKRRLRMNLLMRSRFWDIVRAALVAVALVVAGCLAGCATAFRSPPKPTCTPSWTGTCSATPTRLRTPMRLRDSSGASRPTCRGTTTSSTRFATNQTRHHLGRREGVCRAHHPHHPRERP